MTTAIADLGTNCTLPVRLHGVDGARLRTAPCAAAEGQ